MDKLTSNSDLYQCPFCGGKVKNWAISFGTGDVVGQVFCPSCDAHGPMAHKDCEECALEEAARLWNSPLIQYYMDLRFVEGVGRKT